MASWRIVELDPVGGEPPPRRVLDPTVVVGVVVVALVALNVVPQMLLRQPAPIGPEFTVAPSLTPSTAWTAFGLESSSHFALACGSFSASLPAPTFTGTPTSMHRIDIDVALAADRDWAWCVAGVRVYQDGLELVGTLSVRGRQTTGALRPALRDATFGAGIPGFGGLGPSELIDVNGFAVLRLRAVSDATNRRAFMTAAESASSIRLRLEAMAGPWSFGTVPLREGPLSVSAEAYGVAFQLHDLRLLNDAVATTLYARSDAPDPAIVSFEWDAVDDLGTTYHALPDRRVDGTLPGFYRAFAPAAPADARQIAFSIRRVHLVSLDQFTVDLPLR